MNAATQKHVSTESARTPAHMRGVEQMQSVPPKSINQNVHACLGMMVIPMFSASSLSAEQIPTVPTPWLAGMKSVLTLVTVLLMLIVMPGITEATAHVAQASLETPTLLAAILVRKTLHLRVCIQNSPSLVLQFPSQLKKTTLAKRMLIVPVSKLASMVTVKTLA